MKDQFVLSPFFLDEPLSGLETLAKPGWIIHKPLLPNSDKQTRISAINRGIAHIVAEIISERKRPVSIAGDCVSAIGVLTGLQNVGISPFLIWFDAHGDFNTWETSPSGFLGGMPLAMIVGRGEQAIAKAVGLNPFPETQIILTDARDLDAGERQSLQESAIIHFRHPDSLAGYPLPDMPLYIHIDTDIIDPDEAPAMNYPAPGGLSVAELKNVFCQLAEKKQIVAISVSSWNPRLDQNKNSEKAGMDLLGSLLRSD